MIKPSRIIFILCLISLLARFIIDIYLPSLPNMAHTFHVPMEKIQLAFILYFLSFGFSQLIYGPLSDHYGRKIVISSGLAILLLGNLACTFAHSFSFLLGARFVTGIGAGACGTLNRAIASDYFKGSEFSKAWSYTTTALVITLCTAPLLGGYAQELLGWRANAFLATLVTTIALIVVIKYLPETNQSRRKLLSDLFPSFLHIYTNYKTILMTRSFIHSTLCYTLSFSGLVAYFQVSPILLINGFGLTPSEYGWCSLIIAMSYLTGGFLVNKFVPHFGTQRLLTAGTIILTLGGLSLLMAHITEKSSIATTLLPIALYIVGARIVIPNAIAASMEPLRHLNGYCSALVGFIQMLGSALIGFCISLFDNTHILPLGMLLTIIGCATFILAIHAKRKCLLDTQALKQEQSSHVIATVIPSHSE